MDTKPEGQGAGEDFTEWVEKYKLSMSDGTFAWHFLSVEHLREAYMAGLEAGRREDRAQE